MFDREILRAYFTSGIVDFHADAPDIEARRDFSRKAVDARNYFLTLLITKLDG